MKIQKRVTVDLGPDTEIVVELREYDKSNYQVRMDEVLVLGLTDYNAAVKLFNNIVMGLIQ